MPELQKNMYLYHGSYCEVSQPDLSKCAKYKDFGQGFYLTSSKEQAQSFLKLSIRKAVDYHQIASQDYGFISKFRCTR